MRDTSIVRNSTVASYSEGAVKPQRYEETVRIEFQGIPLRVSLIVDSCIDEDYNITVDGMQPIIRVEYVFISTFIDQPPRYFTDHEIVLIVQQAQAEFIRQRNQWT